MQRNEIVMYITCKQCAIEANELPGESPKSYERLEIGFTDDGLLQIWCNRHEEHVQFIGAGLAQVTTKT